MHCHKLRRLIIHVKSDSAEDEQCWHGNSWSSGGDLGEECNGAVDQDREVFSSQECVSSKSRIRGLNEFIGHLRIGQCGSQSIHSEVLRVP